MTWYAIRTHPAAQRPQREYVVERTRSSKGYRIVPSLDPRLSAVERSLTEAGFVHYMPAEFRAVRHRRKTGVYEVRRFPLLPGYMFVTDWRHVSDVPGVAGVIGSEGQPFAIALTDIMALRTIEARSEAEADRRAEQLAKGAQKETRRNKTAEVARVKKRILAGARVKVQWGAAIGREATILGWQDDGTVRAIADGLDAAGIITIAHDEMRLIAAE